MRHLLLILCLLASARLSVAAPARSVMGPKEPRWGDEVQLIYRAHAPGAKLARNQPVFALVDLYYNDHVEQQRLRASASGDDDVRAVLIIPAGACFLEAHFVSSDAYEAAISSMIRDGKGQPARGAWRQSMLSPSLKKDFLERAAKEFELYPDNWAAYRDKWFLVAGQQDRPALQEMIVADLATIKRAAPEHSPDALYALGYGNLLLGREPDARAAVRELIARYPDHYFTIAAIVSYQSQGYAQHFEEEHLNEVGRWAAESFRAHPASEAARSSIDAYGIVQYLPADLIESICRFWIKDDPENPKPYVQLAGNAALPPEEALQNAVRALDLLNAGELRIRGDLSGKLTDQLVSYAAVTAAKLALQMNRTAQALSYVRLAETSGSEAAPYPYTVEAQIWNKLGRPSRQQAALKEAWARGDEQAHQQLAAMSSEPSRPPLRNNGNRRRLMPEFTATTLDGRRITSSDLRGKIAVANFWFTGCAPCKAEIPDLNRLVAEFAGQDVVFLAFANDEEEDVLQRFLQQFPFTYTVLPHTGEIASLFQVHSYPSHVIVGRDGVIESFLVGASEHRADELRTVIKRLLADAATDHAQ